MRRLASASCLLVAVVWSGAARAGDFVDTRINFTLTDENLLAKPGETNPSVPGIRIGAPNSLGILFFDNYDTRYTGYENLTHLVIYKKMDTARVTAEAAYVLRLLQFTDVNLSSIDDGSYIRLTYWFDRAHEAGGSKRNLAFTAFPLNADRMRLGYSYRISWGGSPIFFKVNPDIPAGDSGQRFASNNNPAPGAKLQLSDERWYVYAGFKTSMLLNRNPDVNEQVAVYGLLAGAGYDIVKEHVRLEGNGGYFTRGTNPLFYGTNVGPQGNYSFIDYPVATAGGTLQLSVFNGLSPTLSIDYTLYKNDPMVSASRYFSKPVYTPALTWLASGEFTLETTTLQDADRQTSTKRQLGYAGDVNLRAQKGHARFKVDFETRSLSYILINQPSLVPFQDFPNNSDVQAELFGSIGMDYNFERYGLTVGPTIGLERPATFTPPGRVLPPSLGGNTGGSLNNSGTLVVRNEGDFSILPTADQNGKPLREVPLFAAKLEAREDFLDWFAAILQVYYQHDGNQTHLVKADDGSSVRQFNRADQLGFNLTLQARF